MSPRGPWEPARELLAQIVGCPPECVSADGFTLTPVSDGGAVVTVTVVRRIGMEQATRLGAALAVSRDPD